MVTTCDLKHWVGKGEIQQRACKWQTVGALSVGEATAAEDASKTNTEAGVVGRPFSRTPRHRQATGESSRRIGFASRVLSNIAMNYDRERLETLRVALGASSLALRYDQTRGAERGDLGLRGKYGHIYIDGAGFLLCVSGIDERTFTARRWSAIKKRL
jgi:hypothetical protein